MRLDFPCQFEQFARILQLDPDRSAIVSWSVQRARVEGHHLNDLSAIFPEDQVPGTPQQALFWWLFTEFTDCIVYRCPGRSMDDQSALGQLRLWTDVRTWVEPKVEVFTFSLFDHQVVQFIDSHHKPPH